MARNTTALLAAALIAAMPAATALAQTAPSGEATPAANAEPSSPAAPAPSPANEPAAAPEPAPAEAPAAESAPAPATGEAAPATGEAAAAPAEEEALGSYYTQSTHGDWQLRCMRTGQGQDPCELYQLMRDTDGSPVAEVSVIPFSGDPAAIVNFVAPLETDLGTGLGLQVDSGENRAFPFMVCARIGCISRIGITGSELDALKRGSKATVTLLPFGAQPDTHTVRLNMSLSGFTAGFNELQSTMQAAAAAQPAEGKPEAEQPAQ